MKTEGKKIAFLGDSITYGIGTSALENRYADLVTAEGKFAVGYNYGISGTRIAVQRHEAFGDRRETFVERVERMEKDVDCVIVFGGTNDFGSGDAPLGRFGDTEKETFYGAMDTLVRLLIEKYPTSKIVVMTPLHRRNENALFNDWGVRNCGTLADYVQAEREVCEKYSVPVLDLYRTSGICPENEVNREKYAPDGLHPNDLGARVIADKLLQFLQNEI